MYEVNKFFNSFLPKNANVRATLDWCFIHLSWMLNGKLTGVVGISTDTTTSMFCKLNHALYSVCKTCYSFASLENGVHKKTIKKSLLPNEALRLFELQGQPPALLGRRLARINVHGDIENEVHWKNILNLVLANPKTQFSLFTKNAKLFGAVFKIYVKPDNLTMVYSVPALNAVDTKKPYWADKVFVVIEKGLEGVEPNCEEKLCAECEMCFHQGGESRIIEVQRTGKTGHNRSFKGIKVIPS